MIYFDNAATTLQKPPEVARAVAQAIETCASVGRGGHAPAMLAAQAVYDCRVLAGELFDCDPEQVVFTMNATHGLNIALASLVQPGDRVLITGFEHNAVTRPLYARRARVEVAADRLFDQASLLVGWEAGVARRPKAAVCTWVSNVFGNILPVEKMARICRNHGVPLVIDASQAAGTLSVSLIRTGAAFLAMPGHKGLYGPQGTGLLLCGGGAEALLQGGTGSESISQCMPEALPDRLEAGTHNVCGIAGLKAGLAYVRERGPENILAWEKKLCAILQEELADLPKLRAFFGPEQSGVVSFQVADVDCETAAEQLAEAGIAVRAGLHCAPLAHETAGTLLAGTVRVSFSDFNTPEEVRRFAQQCKKLFCPTFFPQLPLAIDGKIGYNYTNKKV